MRLLPASMAAVIATAFAFALASSGCDLVKDTGSCERPNVSSDSTCHEFTSNAAFVATEKTACEQLKGKWKDGPCDLANVVAGCRSEGPDNTVLTVWFHASATIKTTADVKKHCDSNQTLVTK